MERALIIGRSGGIGAAVAQALQRRGWSVTGLSRSHDGLDVTSEASVKQHLGALSGQFDMVFVATGQLNGAGHPPEKTLRSVTPEAMVQQFAVNCIGPSLVLKHAMRLLPRDRRAVFAALSARVGSIGDNRLGGWYSYRTAKAALNQMVHSASIEIGRTHPQGICVALHPGTVQTAFTERYAGRHATVPAQTAAQNLLSVLDGLTPDDTGRFFDWRAEEIPW